MAELTEFRRLLRQCFADSQFFWDLAPANTPFAWYGDVDDIPTGWHVLEDADGRYIVGSIDTAGTLGGSSADLAHSGTAVANPSVSVGNHVDDVITLNGSNTTDTVTDDGANQKSVLTGHTTHQLSLNLTHSVTATQGAVTQPNDHARSDINPLSLSFIWIVKDS